MNKASFDQKLAWAAKTQFKGDVRIRQETIKIDGEPNNGGRDKDRQRIRARLGAYTEINPQVDTGIRIATGGGDDARSTNQDQDNYFDKKQIWLDLGYIDYHPDQIKNLHVIGGKMLQPWVSMGDVIWDSDINPEGLAVTYKYPLGSSAELFGSLGNYNLKDNVDGDGVQFRHDLRLTAGQLGSRFDDHRQPETDPGRQRLRLPERRRQPLHRHFHTVRPGGQRQLGQQRIPSVRRASARSTSAACQCRCRSTVST